MPNWTSNNLRAEGIEKMPLFDDKGNFDFNRIIPMPESIRDTECGSREQPSIFAYLINSMGLFSEEYVNVSREDLEKIGKYLKTGLLPEDGLGRRKWDDLFERAMNAFDGDFGRACKEGRKYVENIDKYGHADWYGWACANWGVKWNASETHVSEGCISFDTPWGPPDEAVKALSAQHPNVEFELEYQLEDEPFTIRTMWFMNGKLTDEDEDTDEEALSEYEDEMEAFA